MLSDARKSTTTKDRTQMGVLLKAKEEELWKFKYFTVAKL
jgi:hypothetical protein